MPDSIQVVGIGASAGGLESFVQLLNALPIDTGFSFVFVQHLDPTHPSMATEILNRETQMPVFETRQNTRVKPNCVYTIPPNFDISIQSGVLKLTPRGSSKHPHMPVDAFFQSLAKYSGRNAIGVILSGMASDGTEGLRAIKAVGGITMVQVPSTAKFPSMPQSAVDANVANHILNLQSIANELAKTAKKPKKLGPRQAPILPNSELASDQIRLSEPIDQILALLWRHKKVDFSEYKKTNLIRRIARRMSVLKQSSEKEYADFLKNNPEEVTKLFFEIPIHVTGFFRDKKEFNLLKKKILPIITKRIQQENPIRIWVAGCSTGEEAYSIAILISDYIHEHSLAHSIQIFASDISDIAIQKARLGIYSESDMKSIPPTLKNRYFTECSEGFKVVKSIRDLCLFSVHDLMSDPPFAKLDLISCRNLLIYFNANLQKRIFPILHYALIPGGYLFLGQSENVGGFTNLFRQIDKDYKIFTKTTTHSDVPKLHYPIGRYSSEKSFPPKPISTFKSTFDIHKEADRIVAIKYGPSGVIINENLEIVSFRGRTAPYLEQQGGTASHQLLKMAHPDLGSEIRNIIQIVKAQLSSFRKENVAIGDGNGEEYLNIEAIPLNPLAPVINRQYLILFEKILNPNAPNTIQKPTEPQGKVDQRIRQLEYKIASSKEYQQALSLDHQIAQEEAASANEDLQSANEELQSANEELETAKEELQSTNEELTTVNDELQIRNNELGDLNNDLVNLLSSIEIPIIIVSAELKIRRFTPAATKILNLIVTDVGRSISDIRSNLRLPNLETLVANVIDNLKIKEIEVQDHRGHWYRLKIRPYKTTDNKIDGAVLTFVDIEVLMKALSRLKGALSNATSVADALKIPSVIIDRGLRIRSVNQLFCEIFDISAAEKEGTLLSDLVSKVMHDSELNAHLENALDFEKSFQDIEVSGDFPGFGRRTFLVSARHIHWGELPDPEPESVVVAFFEITERKQIEIKLEESEETYRTLLESAHDAIVAVDEKGKIKVVNAQTEKFFGYRRRELIGEKVEMLVPEEARAAHANLQKEYIQKPVPTHMSEKVDLLGQRKNGSTFPIEVSLSPVKISRGQLIIAVIRDVTSRRQTEQDRNSLLLSEQGARKEAEKANRAKDLFLATLSHELRTPLSSIMTWSQLIRHGKVDYEKAKIGASVIEQSAKAQSQLIDDLLDISRITAGKLAIEITEIDIKNVIPLAIESVSALSDKKSITITQKITDECGMVLANAIRIQQIIWNLLSNAIKFAPKQSEIEVAFDYFQESNRRLARIKVTDCGKGIPEEFIPHIFNRFSQADSTSTRIHGGLGLGLSIVASLVELQGGVVTAENSKTGTGAIFTVTFPVVPAKVAITSFTVADTRINNENLGQDKKEAPSLEGYKILVVDDDESTREALAIYLKSFGAEVLSTDSARETLKQIATFNPDILLSDIAMPEMDGYSLIKEIRLSNQLHIRNVPALALTAYATEADVQQAIDAGFQAHCPKPIDAGELARVIVKYALKS
tara:strand:- start:22540 stop:27075 length:4536 start_codon:yes stop_codon:yes gene_type:complete